MRQWWTWTVETRDQVRSIATLAEYITKTSYLPREYKLPSSRGGSDRRYQRWAEIVIRLRDHERRERRRAALLDLRLRQANLLDPLNASWVTTVVRTKQHTRASLTRKTSHDCETIVNMVVEFISDV